MDQLLEGRGVWFVLGFEFYVTHVLASSVEQIGRVVQVCAVEEADVGMALEDVDVGEWDVFHAGDGMAIVQ